MFSKQKLSDRCSAEPAANDAWTAPSAPGGAALETESPSAPRLNSILSVAVTCHSLSLEAEGSAAPPKREEKASGANPKGAPGPDTSTTR